MKEQVQQIRITELHPFRNHPFYVKDDESMQALCESIREFGVLSPLLARSKGDNFELVSGHRRRSAALKLGLEKLPEMSAQDKEWYLNNLVSCDLLIVDDFGMERQTDYAREQVFNIIDGRYLARKPLIVTTNLSLHELKHP